MLEKNNVTCSCCKLFAADAYGTVGNVNELIHADHLDPYSGFPGYKQFRCKLKRV